MMMMEVVGYLLTTNRKKGRKREKKIKTRDGWSPLMPPGDGGRRGMAFEVVGVVFSRVREPERSSLDTLVDSLSLRLTHPVKL